MEYTELVGTDSIINEQYPKNIGNENELIVNEFENKSIYKFGLSVCLSVCLFVCIQ